MSVLRFLQMLKGSFSFCQMVIILCILHGGCENWITHLWKVPDLFNKWRLFIWEVYSQACNCKRNSFWLMLLNINLYRMCLFFIWMQSFKVFSEYQSHHDPRKWVSLFHSWGREAQEVWTNCQYFHQRTKGEWNLGGSENVLPIVICVSFLWLLQWNITNFMA